MIPGLIAQLFGSKGTGNNSHTVRTLIIAAVEAHLQMLTSTFSVELIPSIPTLLTVQAARTCLSPA